jgi:hypothetical protein
MPKKKSEESGPSEEPGLLVSTAKALGTAAGKIAAMVGATPEGTSAKQSAKGRLPKKNKSRLPRRQKKAQRKAAA